MTSARPSFSVNPLKKVYHCFGCQASGDEITFVVEKEGLDFSGAIEWLADRYNVAPRVRGELAAGGSAARASATGCSGCSTRRRRSTRGSCGRRPRPEQARAYLAERGITRETAQTYRVGYAPGKGDRLVARGAGQGVQRRRSSRGPGSRRPAAAATGSGGGRCSRWRTCAARVRGFGARQMPGGRPPKYLNSQDGPLFRKSEIVYGLDLARADVARQGCRHCRRGLHRRAAAAPGRDRERGGLDGHRLDRAAGESSCAGRAGTVFLAFDADAAGEEASIRGMELAQAARPAPCGWSRCPTGETRLTSRWRPRTRCGRPSTPPRPTSATACGGRWRPGGTRDERYQRVRAVLAAAAAVAGAGRAGAAGQRPAGADAGPGGCPVVRQAPCRSCLPVADGSGVRPATATKLFPGSLPGVPQCWVPICLERSMWHTSTLRRVGRLRRMSAGHWRERPRLRRHIRGHPRWRS